LPFAGHLDFSRVGAFGHSFGGMAAAHACQIDRRIKACLNQDGLAAMQPALRTTKSAHIRTDAEAFFVVDVSRSMLASRSANSATRLARAKTEALALDAIPEVPSGIATLTDRVVPNLLPNPDRNVFGQTITRAVKIQDPPSVSSNPQATSLEALGAIGTQNFFGRAARQRVLVVLTDGGERRVRPGQGRQGPPAGPTGVKVVVVQMGDSNEQVFEPDGKPETGYHAHPESSTLIASLISATGGRSFGEGSSARRRGRSRRPPAPARPSCKGARNRRGRSRRSSRFSRSCRCSSCCRAWAAASVPPSGCSSAEAGRALGWLRQRSKPRAQVPERASRSLAETPHRPGSRRVVAAGTRLCGTFLLLATFTAVRLGEIRSNRRATLLAVCVPGVANCA
jgi:hypothetical protein